MILDRLDKRGLLRRVRSETDRRAQHVQITPKGRTLTRKAHQLSEQMEAELLGPLSQAERAMLFELLQKVASYRKPRPAGGKPPAQAGLPG